MSKERRARTIVLSPAAKIDIRKILRWSEEHFGKQAALRYEELIGQALRDIERDPNLPGIQRREELGKGVMVYSTRFSREHVSESVGTVHEPRHLIIYRCQNGAIEVSRILHDSRDIIRHVPVPD